MVAHGRCLRPEVRFFVLDEGTDDEQVAGLLPGQIRVFNTLGRIDMAKEMFVQPEPLDS